MRKFWPYATYAQPYLHNREDEAVKASDRELLRKLLGVVVAVAIFVIAMMFYRDMQGWPVFQK